MKKEERNDVKTEGEGGLTQLLQIIYYSQQKSQLQNLVLHVYSVHYV